ncbi:MAG TPA: TIR domain-containing protein [Pyrinomonadaceae bacterium]|jgi:tetratricopeptide (TPR) repeat protein|nr:TIR domain-containing protein [Pyrinomonadaceae bacterium]
MSDIFISYAREDRPNAERLARVFERQGWTVWWDKVIPPGRRYGDVIAEQLAAAKAVVVLWSRTSAASDWVKDEAQEGAARNVLVSMLVEKVTPPLGFRQFQMGDLSEWDGSDDDPNLQDVLRAVADLIKRPYDATGVVSRPAPPPRLTWLYFAVGVALVAALGFAAFRMLRGGGPGPVANDGNVGGPVVNSSPPKPGPSGCSRDASQKAADLTGKGLTFIDKDGNHAAAVLQFNEALAECPNYVDAYFYRGQSYAVLGKKERAVGDFNKVVQLSSDPDIDYEAQELIAGLTGAPRPTPTPPRPPPPSDPLGGTATNTAAPTPAPTAQNANATPPRPANPAKVADIFAADRGTRIGATTRLIIEKKRDAGAVKEAVTSALADPGNKSGVINTLVYLENVDPEVLKQYRPEIEKLFAVAKDNGPETVKHIDKVRQRMGG